MKKIIFSVMLITTIGNAMAQDKSVVFSSNDMVWYGLDFTKAKFIGGFNQVGDAGAVTGSDLKAKWIPGWNNLILNEATKFDLRKTFRKDNVVNDISSVSELNSKIDPDNCMSFNENKIERSVIDDMVKKYNGEKKEGLGLSFIVENFNKTSQMADIYVTFFDIKTKKVLLCEKVSGKAVGIGMRNYWAGAIKAILKQIDTSEYKNWKKG